MFKNYLKIAIRQLLKNKSFSIINISGLAIGMGVVILILLWIQSEVSYDNFHTKKDRIYELWNRGVYSNNLECWNTTPMVAAKALRHDIPEIETAVRVNWPSEYLVTVGDKKIKILGTAIDKEFLDVFTFPMIKGDAKNVLSNGNSIVLTQKTAEKIFGEKDPIGQIININNKDNLTVTGIISNPPSNTRFDFECLVSWDFLTKEEKEDSEWGNNSTRTYVMLKDHASFESAQSKVLTIRKKYQDEKDAFDMFFISYEPMEITF